MPSPLRGLLPALLATLLLLAPVALAQEDSLAPVDVVLDPGHSRVDVGAGGGGLSEYEVTLDLAQRTRQYLEAAGLAVRLTREDHEPLTAMVNPAATSTIQQEQSARIAAGGPTRVYVSLHLNGPPSLRGTETYFNPERGDTPEADAALAEAIQRNVVQALGDYGYATLDRGAKSDLTAGKPYGHFFSLRGPAPSALLEALFLSNPSESQLLWDDAARKAIARGCALGILDYLVSATA